MACLGVGERWLNLLICDGLWGMGGEGQEENAGNLESNTHAGDTGTGEGANGGVLSAAAPQREGSKLTWGKHSRVDEV